ncbi:MAG: DEAD/DEAH box helicase [Clostridium perfringens]|nr:DEAD/DEAH box helicase [Clostridium perfringens]
MNNKFESLNLNVDILKAIENLGFKKPSNVQIEVIPTLLEKKDVIVKSKTGSGKTASFGIPLCQNVDIESHKVQGIVLAPTRELVLQIKEDISNIGRIKKVRCEAIFGKQSMEGQIKKLKQRTHIVAGTPGRIIDHLQRETLDLSSVDFVVLDEADKMLSMGFIDQIEEVLKRVNKNATIGLFSATIPEKIEYLCNSYMKNPKLIEIKTLDIEKKIEEKYISLDNNEKKKALWQVLYAKHPNQGIVFCNTKDKVNEVLKNLKEENILAKSIHGGMEQRDRLAVMEEFKNKEFKVLVATDVAARGIHIEDLGLVINYEVPMENESYVHRIGRTGRSGKEGTAISFVAHYEKRYLDSIKEYTKKDIEETFCPSKDEVLQGKKIFKENQNEMIKSSEIKVAKKEIHKDIVKIHISAGKKKKIRALDILGCFSNLEGVTGDDIGIIDILDNISYVDILNGKGNLVLKNNKAVKIKGKSVKIEKAKK